MWIASLDTESYDQGGIGRIGPSAAPASWAFGRSLQSAPPIALRCTLLPGHRKFLQWDLRYATQPQQLKSGKNTEIAWWSSSITSKPFVMITSGRKPLKTLITRYNWNRTLSRSEMLQNAFFNSTPTHNSAPSNPCLTQQLGQVCRSWNCPATRIYLGGSEPVENWPKPIGILRLIF